MWIRTLVVAGFGLAALAAGTGAAAESTPDPTGLWLTENKRSAIRVTRCESGLCGEVAWIIDGGMQYDRKNPDPDKRDRPICGLRILWGVAQQPDDPADWEDGTVYKADEGETYDVDLTVQGPDTMKVRGYVGIALFGKSQVWTRVSPEDHPPCAPPESPPKSARES